MITLLDKSKVSFFDYFYLFCVIIFAAQSSGLVRGFGDIRTVGNSFLLGMTFLYAMHRKVTIDRTFFTVVGVLTLYSALVIVATHSSEYFIYEYSRWIMVFLVSFVICKGYGYRLFIISETILYHLAIIALIGWVILILFPYQFTELASHISLKGFNEGGDAYADLYAEYNIIIYTINGINHLGETGDFYLFTRNAGFAWEPGVFACFMCFAIYFNIMRVGRFRHNKVFFVFLIALISTQSTTGYVTFALMMIIWVATSRKLYWLLVLIPVILLGLNLPFISEKIIANTEDIRSVTLESAAQDGRYDRLFSFALLWDEFLLHPILGYGFSESTLMKYDIFVFSGIGKLLAQYGIIMSLLLLALLCNTSRNLNMITHSRMGYALLIIMLGMMISYSIWNQPFFATFWLYSVFIKGTPKQVQLTVLKST